LKILRHNTLGVCNTCSSLKELMHSLSCHSKERGNLQVHSRNIYLKFERKDMLKLKGFKILPLILRVPGLSRRILCRIFFSLLNATDQNPGMYCNGNFF
jgi:hypothetical protein